jgi:hypothetical protein
MENKNKKQLFFLTVIISFIYQLAPFSLSPTLFQRIRPFRLISLILLLSIVSFILLLEFYYQYGQCAVSQKYSRKNVELTHRVIDMLDDLSISYWPDCQSLLNVLRNETYNVWDHDVDLSIEWPLRLTHSDSKLNNIKILIKTIEQYGFEVEFYPDRQLLSLYPRDDISIQQSHVDIWLWTRKYRYDHYENKNDEKEFVLEMLDFSFKYQNRSISHIYPLRTSTWLGRNITIAFDSHIIAYKEFGASYMKATVFRRDCMHNLFNGRWI